MKGCTASAYSPYAEIVYDSLEEYYQNKGKLQKAARKKDVARIDVSVTSFSPQDCITTNDDPNYPWEYVLQDIGMEENEYDGTGIKIGVIEAGTCSSGILASPSNYHELGTVHADSLQSTHGNAVLGIMGASDGIAPGATYYHHHSPFSLNTMEDLIDEGVDVINMSATVAFNFVYDIYCAYLDYVVYTTGVTFVTSAGNTPYCEGTTSIDNHVFVTSPGNAANAITVGATNADGARADFSRAGNSMMNIFKPDLVAPGSKIYIPINNCTEPVSGTSFSTPIVTGVIARLMQEFPELKDDPALLKVILLQGCVLSANQGPIDPFKGAGIVNYENSRCIMIDHAYAVGIKLPNSSNGVICTMNAIAWEGATAYVRICATVPQSLSALTTTEIRDGYYVFPMSTYKISFVDYADGEEYVIQWGAFYAGGGCLTIDTPYTGTYSGQIKVELYYEEPCNANMAERVAIATNMTVW